MEEEITRTILVSNFAKNATPKDILAICNKMGEVREHYTMQNKGSVLFVSFFDIRAAEKACAELRQKKEGYLVKYTINRNEIPSGTDECTEEKHQGSISYVSSGQNLLPANAASVYDKADANGVSILRFYDTRDALKHLGSLKKTRPQTSPKCVWDRDLRARRKLLLEAEEVLKSATIGNIRSSSDAKRTAPTEDSDRKRQKKGGNWMLILFDQFIATHSLEVSKILE